LFEWEKRIGDIGAAMRRFEKSGGPDYTDREK